MSDSGEKIFDPTPRRLAEAARKGDVFRSRELTNAVVMLVGACWLMLAGPWMLQAMEQMARSGLIFDRTSLTGFEPGRAIMLAAEAVLPPLALLALPVLLVSVISQTGMGEGRFVGANLAFKGSRINPLSGLKRMFGLNGLIEMGKGLLKISLLGAIGWLCIRYWFPSLAGMGRGGLADQLQTGWSALLSLLFALTAGLVIIALVDLPIQWRQRMKRLRMSHQDMRDEAKEAEGSQEARAARKQRQRDIARGAVAPVMRDAQFVITNPVHFAIALTYDPERASAPIVLAKGRGEKAAAMRELAGELKLPVLEYPQLARAIFFTTREQHTIREELYAAVAAIVAFVLSLRRGEQPVLPAITIPVELRFDAEGRREKNASMQQG